MQHHPSENILLILTDGEFVWDSVAADFDWEKTNALPENLRNLFNEEPLYLYLRWAKNEEHLSLDHPQFRDVIAKLAATLQGRFMDELVGEEVRQHWERYSVKAKKGGKRKK